MSGQIEGTTHLCQGQEAVSVGAVSAMQPGDVQTNTYRGHGEALALGMDPETAFAELMGRSTGGSKGLGGSMHLIDTAKGNIGANATSRALVLLDGVPQNDPFGAWIYWHRYNMDSLADVSINPSGGGEAWGNFGSGGVISLISAEPESKAFSSEAT